MILNRPSVTVGHCRNHIIQRDTILLKNTHEQLPPFSLCPKSSSGSVCRIIIGGYEVHIYRHFKKSDMLFFSFRCCTESVTPNFSLWSNYLILPWVVQLAGIIYLTLYHTIHHSPRSVSSSLPWKMCSCWCQHSGNVHSSQVMISRSTKHRSNFLLLNLLVESSCHK